MDVTVLSTAHDVADARLRRLCDALNERGLRVLLDASGDDRQAPPHVTVIARTQVMRWRRLIRAMSAPARVRSKVLVVVDPELAVPAYLWTRVRRQVLVIDMHEDYLAAAAERPWLASYQRRLARVLVRLAIAAARRADLTSVADDHLAPQSARHRLVVRNLPRPGEQPDAGTPDTEPRAVYIGDLRPARGLLTMLDAMRNAPEWSLDLVGGAAEPGEDLLRQWIAERGLGDGVRWHGRLALPEAWQVARGAWVGLCLLEPTPAYCAAVPTKVLEYLSVGLPVLATPLPRVAPMLAAAGAGVVVSGADEAAAILRGWARRPYPLHAARHAARRYAAAELARQPDPYGEFADALVTMLPAPSRPGSQRVPHAQRAIHE